MYSGVKPEPDVFGITSIMEVRLIAKPMLVENSGKSSLSSTAQDNQAQTVIIANSDFLVKRFIAPVSVQ